MAKISNAVSENMERFTHRYKWSLEEKIVLSLLGLVTVASLVLTFVFGSFQIGWMILAVFAFLVGIWAFYIGYSRKNKSQLIANLHKKENRLGVGGHKLEELNNNVILSRVNRAAVRSKGNPRDGELFTPRDEFILACDSDQGSKTMIFPIRLFSDAKFAALVEGVINDNKAKIDDDTRAAIEFGKKYKG